MSIRSPDSLPAKPMSAGTSVCRTIQILRAAKAPGDPIYFMGATHPQHNPTAGYGWIKLRQDHEIRSHTGRQRLNINGAIGCASLLPSVRDDDTINAQSVLSLLQQIEQKHPLVQRIQVISDNTCYCRSQAVTDYLRDSNNELIYCHGRHPT